MNQQFSPLLKQHTLKKYGAAYGLASVIFLWPIQVWLLGVGIPLYVLTSLVLLIISRFTYKNIFFFFFLTFFFLLLSSVQCLQGIYFTTPLRSFTAIPVFTFVMICSCRWIQIIQKSNYLIFFKICRIFLIIQFAIQIVQIVLYKMGIFHVNYHYVFGLPRCSGLFSEPSHIAYGLSPFLYLFAFHKKFFFKFVGKMGAIVLALVFIICPSSTLVAVSMVIVLFILLRSCNSVKSTIKLLVPILLVLTVIAGAILYIPATSDRVLDLFNLILNPEDASSGDNLSSLLFLKGFQMALASLQYYPLGSGFLNFQFLNDYSSVSMINEILYTMNAYEGTSVGFKLIGEYGYLGLFILIYVFYRFYENVRKSNIYCIFENFILFGLIVGCIRGPSYFDGFPVLAFSMVCTRFLKKLKLKTCDRKIDVNRCCEHIE